MSRKDAFALLGLPIILDLKSEEIEAAYLKANQQVLSKVDGEGQEAQGAKESLNQAKQDLLKCSKRIQLFLQVRTEAAEEAFKTKGMPGTAVMETFEKVQPILQDAEAFVKTYEAQQSAIGKASMMTEWMKVKSTLEEVKGKLDGLHQELSLQVRTIPPSSEEGNPLGPNQRKTLQQLALDFAFCEKWQSHVHALFGRLI